MKIQIDRDKLNNSSEKRRQKRLQQKRDSFKKRKSEIQKTLKKSQKSKSKSAEYKRIQRERNKERKEKDKIRQRKYRQNKCNKTNKNSLKETPNQSALYNNRMQKSRIMKKLSNSLPKSPMKRAGILHDFIKMNPEDEKHFSHFSEISTFESSPVSVEKSAITNLKEFIQSTKFKRSEEARRVMNIVTASVSSENLQEKHKMSLAKRLGVKPSRIAGGQRIRTNVLKSEKSCFEFVSRKKRSDTITDENKKLIYDFWLSPEISRLTGNKNDVKRMRVGPKLYTSHQIQILEKSQTEAYLEFRNKYPNTKLSQRSFESLKPFFVIPMRKKDRCTCCCRICVETKMLFKKCMDFRKLVLKDKSENYKLKFPIYEHLQEFVNATLCSNDKNPLHNIKCLKRECADCGAQLINFLPEEVQDSTEENFVKWEKYEYITLSLKGGKTRRKLQLVQKSTSPCDMVSYFCNLVKLFPSHQFRANWQNKQYRTLTGNLPLNTAVVVHDFSENYRCIEKNELQSSYFQKSEISIHVSILHCHAVLEYDQTEESDIITEQFIVISDDLQHDRHFVKYVQNEISQYLSSIPIAIDNMIEFTDGCSSQYKSRNCMGDISSSCRDLNYKLLSRNYYETSHAKGPQDAAGGFVKKQADITVLHGKCIIQSATDLYTFCNTYLTEPKSGLYKRRLFRYTESIPRPSHPTEFKPIPENRKIHSISASSTSPNFLTISELSCYECDNCLHCDSTACENLPFLGSRGNVKMFTTKKAGIDIDGDAELESEISVSNLLSKGDVVAVLADDTEYEYFLLKILEIPCCITCTQTDQWGNSFPIGANVVKGLYYERKDDRPFQYRIVKNKTAIVYTISVRFLCSDIKGNKTITISESLHEDILDSLEV